MKSGIYCITNIINNKKYIGSTVNLKDRFSGHFSKLRKNKHENCYLQNAFNKYGESCFVFSILEYVPPESLIITEQQWIDRIGIDNLYNIKPTAGSSRGYKMPDEHKEKIRQGNLGKIVSLETREKLRNSAIGHKRNLGRKDSDDTKEKRAKKLRKRVKQICTKTNNVIATWNSIKDASEQLGICKSAISSACNGRYKTAGGFKWELVV